MLEVEAGVVLHAESSKHGERALIARHSESHDSFEVQLLESEAHYLTSCFRSVAVPPIRSCQPPSDLDCRGKGHVEVYVLQPDGTHGSIRGS